MMLEESDLGIKWLEQFLPKDRGAAYLLLRSLKLVSFSELESNLIAHIKSICQQHGAAGLFTVRSEVGVPGEPVVNYGSEHRAGHLLEGLRRENKNLYFVEPSMDILKENRVPNIILVDDLIGSGTRLVTFWKKFANPTINSWLSYKKVRLWLVTYAATSEGINYVTSELSQLDKSNIVFTLEINKKQKLWTDEVHRIGKEYGPNAPAKRSLMGYRGLACNVIFQHGCPNNAPSMLWVRKNGWEPLFPNRVVSTELFPCFEDSANINFVSESLKLSRQFKLANALLERANSKNFKARDLNLLHLLGLLSRGVSARNLSTQLMVSQSEVELHFKRARRMGLVQKSANSLSEFGKDFVERHSGGAYSLKKKKMIKEVEEAIMFYYP